MNNTRAVIITALLVVMVCFSTFMIVADRFISSGISVGFAALVTVGPILALVGIVTYWVFRSSRKHDDDFSNPHEKYAVSRHR